MKKVYSLSINEKEIVSVEMNVPDFLPKLPLLNRNWLKSVITEQLNASVASVTKSSRRGTKPTKTSQRRGVMVPSAGI